MKQLRYLDQWGNFCLTGAQTCTTSYFPLVNEGPMISSITPVLSGDCKSDQNTFLLAPASSETLHESRATRNFWLQTDDFSPWSVCGQSAAQQAKRFTEDEEEVTLTAGLLWQKIARVHRESGIKAEVLSFVPAGHEKIEIMQVILTNESTSLRNIKPTAAIPLYGRSADKIRDHRHVTSLLHRITLGTYGLDLKPTLTFDERGHKKGTVTYRVWGAEGNGNAPIGFIPLVRDFVGSGSYDRPEAIYRPDSACLSFAGDQAAGSEAIGAIIFAEKELLPGESATYQILLAIDDDPTPYLSGIAVEQALGKTQQWWQNANPISVRTGDPQFDAWICWVGIQPVLRRICGCSFLPHHDYGRGGRGWRDLWQDSLALILQDPASVREDLICYFAGVRTDGTNATIIGTKPGEFKADRNNIPRVWMDHGFWPMLTAELYLNETADNSLLLEHQPYFRDTLPHRGEGLPLPRPGIPAEGTVLEHILIQLVTAFFDVGEHGNMRLRGADWNDGLDMARNRGESVAFTAAYAGNLQILADRLAHIGVSEISLPVPLWELMHMSRTSSPEKQAALYRYCDRMEDRFDRVSVSIGQIQNILQDMAHQLKSHIRSHEWVGDDAGHHWFNSYYDDHAQAVEGVTEDGIRMMLTGQVFTLLSGTADSNQAEQIIAAADRYLFDPSRGGYCLNTDFHEVKLDMGRMFGFHYGTKENGAVFCHMAVMYAYSLYSRGYGEAGWKVLAQLYQQCSDFSRSKVLPGIPEYFDDRGMGMYPYLTGSGSWFMLTLQTQVFGVRGENGNLVLDPKLSPCHFDSNGIAQIQCRSAGHRLTVRYHEGSGPVSKVICAETGMIWDCGRIPSSQLSETATLDVFLS